MIIDDIPLDDKKTFELYQQGDTIGTFQFESPGMQKYLRDLKPDKFDDLIAMNALYRPGPIAYIPNYIDRKHGREPIVYDLPEMEEYLERNLWHYRLPGTGDVARAENWQALAKAMRMYCVKRWVKSRNRSWIK